MELTATSLKMPADLKKRIDALARKSGQSAHSFMLQALHSQVEGAEAHRRFVGDALAAEREMQRSGTGHDLNDVRPYLEARLSG